MRRLFVVLFPLTVVTSVLKAQTKSVVPPADSVKKIGKTGESCVPCAAAKAAAKPKQAVKKPVKKPSLPVKKDSVQVPVVPAPKSVLLSDYEIIRDSLRLCKISQEKNNDSLRHLERRVVVLTDSLSKRVSLPKIWVDTVFVDHTSKKAILATAVLSGGAGFLGGYFSHSKNIVTSTIIRNNMTSFPAEERLRQTQSVGVRFTVPIGNW